MFFGHFSLSRGIMMVSKLYGKATGQGYAGLLVAFNAGHEARATNQPEVRRANVHYIICPQQVTGEL